MRRQLLSGLYLLSICIWGCSDAPAPVPVDDKSWMLGGPATVEDVSVNAFGEPAPFLTADERAIFVSGNAFFRTNWVTAPATTTSRDGLGPLFHAASCSGCHLRDGRGLAPAYDPNATGVLIRISVNNGTSPEPTYGWQLAPRAILGVAPEASIGVAYAYTSESYADGTTVTLWKPEYTFSNFGYGPISAHAEFSARLAPQIIGMGLLESIDEATLESIALQQANTTPNITGRRNIGRFGWKASQPTIALQTAHAFAGDMGITTPLVAADDGTVLQQILSTIPNGGSPECEQDAFDNVVFYTTWLAVPAQRRYASDAVVAGKKLFLSAGCGECHRPSIMTSSSATHRAVENKEIHPYTDLLLHDMGPGMADNRPDKNASGAEWRTPPLWGIGLIPTVNGARFLLHDGRARSLEEAIMWHGGEGEAAREAFRKMTAGNRRNLLEFLESL
ncbi:MAG: c-type cytochrome [Candidatus Kapabacteria bacterium]|nr:c-type cytochrome [Candidatus Kapabacteria bacterium]